MSTFAYIFFQDPLLSNFQQRMEEESSKNNLQTLLAAQTIPKGTQLRDVIDAVPSAVLRLYLKRILNDFVAASSSNIFKCYRDNIYAL